MLPAAGGHIGTLMNDARDFCFVSVVALHTAGENTDLGRAENPRSRGAEKSADVLLSNPLILFQHTALFSLCMK